LPDVDTIEPYGAKPASLGAKRVKDCVVGSMIADRLSDLLRMDKPLARRADDELLGF
jgi:hypothetical protein